MKDKTFPLEADTLEKRAWAATVQMQSTGQGGIRLNKDAGIQQQLTTDNEEEGLDLQKVTDEVIIDGHTFMAAESLSGLCPRRVYVWLPGHPVWFFEDPYVTDNDYLFWPVVNRIHSINHPFGEPRSYGLHEGVDLYGLLGDDVVACMNGLVIWASDQRRTGGPSAYGNHVIIEHPNGWITWYAHLDSMSVSRGDFVIRTEKIGVFGSTGNSTGPHLHLNLQIPGLGLSGFVVPDVVNPAEYLR